MYKWNSSYTIYGNLDQVNSIVTAVEGGVISRIKLMNDENCYICIYGKNMELIVRDDI